MTGWIQSYVIVCNSTPGSPPFGFVCTRREMISKVQHYIQKSKATPWSVFKSFHIQHTKMYYSDIFTAFLPTRKRENSSPLSYTDGVPWHTSFLHSHFIFKRVFNTFTLCDAPSRDVWVEHALCMCSVVRHLYDSWAIHIRRKRVHGRSKLLVV